MPSNIHEQYTHEAHSWVPCLRWIAKGTSFSRIDCSARRRLRCEGSAHLVVKGGAEAARGPGLHQGGRGACGVRTYRCSNPPHARFITYANDTPVDGDEILHPASIFGRLYTRDCVLSDKREAGQRGMVLSKA